MQCCCIRKHQIWTPNMWPNLNPKIHDINHEWAEGRKGFEELIARVIGNKAIAMAHGPWPKNSLLRSDILSFLK